MHNARIVGDYCLMLPGNTIAKTREDEILILWYGEEYRRGDREKPTKNHQS